MLKQGCVRRLPSVLPQLHMHLTLKHSQRVHYGKTKKAYLTCSSLKRSLWLGNRKEQALDLSCLLHVRCLRLTWKCISERCHRHKVFPRDECVHHSCCPPPEKMGKASVSPTGNAQYQPEDISSSGSPMGRVHRWASETGTS